MELQEDKISVVIPVFNVEKYLDRCMESMLQQTYRNLEIIVVDDGSTDSSGKMCDEYAKKDGRVRVIHQENAGVSVARNQGIEAATGKYIGFIDADDYVDVDFYEVLYRNLIKEGADVSMCGYISCYQETDIEEIKKNTEIQRFVMDTEEALKNVLEMKNNAVWSWNKLYKKELFEEIRYPVGQTISEDAIVTVDVFLKCQKFVFTTEKKYYYIHRAGSATTAKFSRVNFEAIAAHERNKKIIDERFPALKNVTTFKVCVTCFSVLDKMILASDKQGEKEVVKKLRKNFMFILKNDQFTLARKIAACLLMIHVNLYKIVCQKFYKNNRKIYD